MRTRWTVAAVLVPLSVGAASFRAATPPPEDPVRVVVETEMGTFELEVDVDRAPVTAANFLRYVDGGFYDGGTFFRTVHADNQPEDSIRIAVVQGGWNPDTEAESFPPIPLERTSETGLRHLDGAVSMARGGPDTATQSFFICIGDQPSLDFGGLRNPDGQGFAAFGRVVAGMDVVLAIHRAPYEAQQLTPPLRIVRVYRKEGPSPEVSAWGWLLEVPVKPYANSKSHFRLA
ncbi:peptidylprolyl isomerase [Candidatus Palauibacter sp.]|uniref:peptidylprolyl isomerase n=1 Tax=Candidatus Palauibacter sp. TaxID=3101350 RepID=UPI003B525F57